MLWIFWLFLLLKSPVLATEATTSATIVIDKFQFDPPMVGMKEWVELFNKSDSEIDLNIYKLSDFDNHHKTLVGKIPAGGYFKHEESSGWLNNPGDTIFLKIGESIIDEVEYKIDKNVVVNNLIISDLTNLKGKWIGRSINGDNGWQVFSDTSPPTGGGINYFDGYKTVIENINIGITQVVDQSGIGSTLIITKISNLNNNICENFTTDIGSSLSDGKCYKFEYVAIDGVGNTGIFTSNSIVKFDTSKPDLFTINSAFRNILKLKSEFLANDPQSGMAGYKYGLSNLGCGSTIVPDDWSYIYNSILNIGYSGNPLSILGKAINNAGLESEIGCLDFTIDLIAPKVSRQINPEIGKYKIGDKLPLSFEFSENIETINPNLFAVDKFYFVNKTDKILNFEYEIKENDLKNNLKIGETKITLNGGQIIDIAGNEADLKINNIDDGVEIDGVIPLISLVGETYVEIPQFGNYLDLGVTVSDGEITVKNNVNTGLGGVYEVNYTVTDDAGNKNKAVRKVKVVDTTTPIIKINSDVEKFEFSLDSNEEGNLEWRDKCEGENNNLKIGDNVIKIKNNGDGIYDNCEIRAWDKWGNVGEWKKINSFEVDTTPPIISFVNSSQIEMAIIANEKLKSCNMEKEKLLSGDFETGNIDGWMGEWVVDDLHFAKGKWSAKSPDLKSEDLIEKSIWQKINMESEGLLSFWWRVNSEKDWDFLKFYIDGILVKKISGEVPWQEENYNLNTGEHIIKFIYSKDYSGDEGEDAGWIDNVNIVGVGNIVSMIIEDNLATAKLNNLSGGSNKYKVNCKDRYDNKSEIIERTITININHDEIVLPTPTPHTIFKTSASIPTIKLTTKINKVTTTKKSPAVLGIVTTVTSPPTTKLKSDTPWEEIKFWAMGMIALGTTSGVILLDKKFI